MISEAAQCGQNSGIPVKKVTSRDSSVKQLAVGCRGLC